ncbi:O-antigen/teichoic acid export membrane protein [Rhodobium orientis]|uniref:lipopolysaccharide biosynthesis protein n=1 Tax=Rhodobium orientis TaxID=34017 RepID=UPI0014760B63|nr:lipopolysaccharide biosynthesis protein [Rhodobium orientis]MBB4304178.1 O-antigen/teichoic acid export membrane protein [Rhodobium orientis]
MTAVDLGHQDCAPPGLAARAGRLGVLVGRVCRSDNGALRALMVYGLRIGGAGLIFLAQIAIARWLTPAEYGVFANVWVIFLLIGGWVSLGLGGAMIRFVPEYLALGREDLLRGLRRAGRAVGLTAAIVLACAGIAVLTLGGNIVEPGYRMPLVLALAALPFYAMSDINDGLCRGHGWPLRGIAPIYVLRPLLMIAGVVIAALALGLEPTATNAMAVVAIAFSLTVLVQTVITESGTHGLVPAGPSRYELKTWLAVSMPLVLMEGMLALMNHVDVLLVGSLRGAEEVGLYYAATRVVALVSFVPYAVIAVFGPRFSHGNAMNDHDGLRETARQAVTLSLLPSLVLGIAIVATGPLLLAAFGKEFTAAYNVLLILLVAVTMRAAVAPAQTMLAMTGHHVICVVILAGALALNTGLNLILIPLAGTVGAATATTIAIAVEIGLSLVAVRSRLGFVPMPYGDVRHLVAALRGILTRRAVTVPGPKGPLAG